MSVDVAVYGALANLLEPPIVTPPYLGTLPTLPLRILLGDPGTLFTCLVVKRLLLTRRYLCSSFFLNHILKLAIMTFGDTNA